eukprot:TRINITY_DN4283_c0_g1_i1.p1 TRINITY_DN4283_c0_g1~~TRINITY_DN4283_c0_g1_i1.p1  ORF type:complete len:148 (-),score=17.42 TRINITY_DN4283_c0_g1_i1:132-575(-)
MKEIDPKYKLRVKECRTTRELKLFLFGKGDAENVALLKKATRGRFTETTMMGQPSEKVVDALDQSEFCRNYNGWRSPLYFLIFLFLFFDMSNDSWDQDEVRLCPDVVQSVQCQEVVICNMNEIIRACGPSLPYRGAHGLSRWTSAEL